MRHVAFGVKKAGTVAVLGCLISSMPCAATAREVQGPSPREPGMRLVFAATVVGLRTQIYSIAPSGRVPAQLTFSSEPASNPVPSPDGAHIAFERSDALWVMRPDGSGQRLLARNAIDPAWTPDSRRIAYVRVDADEQSLGIRAIGLGGRGARLLVGGHAVSPSWSPDGRSLAFARQGSLVVLHDGRQHTILDDPEISEAERTRWSFDGRWLALSDFSKVDVVRSDGRHRRDLAGAYPAWAPHRLRLAYFNGAVDVFDPINGRNRKVASATFVNSLAWSPRGDAVAASGGTFSSEDLTSHGDGLLVSTLAGQSRNLVRATDPYALPEAVSWTRVPSKLRFRPPVPVRPRISADELQLRQPVEDLAADGERVAYRFCGTIGVWQPARLKVVSVQRDHPLCDEADLVFYNLALAGDHVSWGVLQGGNFQTNTLAVETVGDQASRTEVAAGQHVTGDLRGDERAGELLGSGSLLVFSTWAYCDEVVPVTCPGLSYGQGPSLDSQTLWRVREASWPGVCPGTFVSPPSGRCQRLRAEHGPLRVLDVDAGRIVVSGDNATLVLDANGGQLLSLPLSTQAAQLTGSSLVVLVPGALRDYDVTTGTLVRSSPVPAVSSGGFCGVPVFFCGTPQLRLEDAAHGLVSYILDGQIHLLRLADGRDVVVHEGTAARFDSAGLAYAYRATGDWPGRIRFVPFDQLPLE
jgi:Tol biopolymer transport system component